eukprot:3527402-Pyramimonas_sp.AAC.1
MCIRDRWGAARKLGETTDSPEKHASSDTCDAASDNKRVSERSCASDVLDATCALLKSKRRVSFCSGSQESRKVQGHTPVNVTVPPDAPHGGLSGLRADGVDGASRGDRVLSAVGVAGEQVTHQCRVPWNVDAGPPEERPTGQWHSRGDRDGSRIRCSSAVILQAVAGACWIKCTTCEMRLDYWP